MSQFQRIAVSTILAALFGSIVLPAIRAQEAEPELLEPKSEMLVTKVLVLDPDGNPVEDATVYCTGLRAKMERGSHYSWNSKMHGTRPKLKTNSEGIVEMPYPKYIVEKLETGTMTWSVEHPDFVDFREDRSLADDPAEIKLSRGFRVAVTAVNGDTGEKIKDDLYAVISGGGTGQWKLHANGMLVSPMFAKQDSTLRIMQIVDGQPILFSPSIKVLPGDRSRVLLQNVKLAKGTRVEGNLDESIERPVKNGYVVACVINKLQPNDWNGRWYWFDKTPIAKDGSFVFESLPPDEVLQMIPICDGWVPKKPAKESILKFFPEELRVLDSSMTIPRLVELAGEKVSTTLEMERATSVRVTVKDPEGKPLAGAEVVMWPNQLWFDGGSQILGTSYPSREALVGTRAGNFEYQRIFRFREFTTENGVAVINNLPPDKSESIAVSHDDFEMPISGDDRHVTVKLESGKIAEVTVQMQKKGTEALGEPTDDGDKTNDQ